MTRKIFFLIFALTFHASTGFAADVVGAKDHPLLPRINNSRIGEYGTRFGTVEFTVDWQGIATKSPLEGSVTELCYFFNNVDYQPSPADVLKQYKTVAKVIGGEVLFERNPSGTDGGEETIRVINKEKEHWIKILPDPLSTPAQSYRLVILERSATQVVKAAELGQEMSKLGFITLHLNFDPNQAKIKPEAKSALAEVAKMMNSWPELNISIEGHTDNSDFPEVNKELSLKQAKSVMRELSYNGVGTDRMSAVGVGQEKPVADNTSETGRQLNRRIELVKR